MDNFKIIYKILKYLEQNLDYEETDITPISAVKLKITEQRWEQLLIMLYNEGYINGIVVSKVVGENKYHIVEPIQPNITLKGLEYLEENSMMHKAKEFARGIVLKK